MFISHDHRAATSAIARLTAAAATARRAALHQSARAAVHRATCAGLVARRAALVLTGVLLAAAMPFAPSAPAALGAEPEATAQAPGDDAGFRNRIAPLIESRCLACHHGVAARGKLSLESREGWLTGGDSGPAIEPGEADASLLVGMIEGDSPDMPRDAPPLSADEVAALRHWIDRGAPWPDGLELVPPSPAETWWSLRPLERPQIPPTLSSTPRSSAAAHRAPTDGDEPAAGTPPVNHPIDAFILQRLDEAGLSLSPEADRRILIRRLALDLTGLPPAPEWVRSFVADDAPDAYERLVDVLLASPHYGERWGRHWLDVAHWAETHGYDKDKRRDRAWPYRDWVIAALNADLPYGRFVRLQVAGDVLEPHNAAAVMASGFAAAGPWDFVGHVELREGSVEKQKTRSLDRDDMLANTMSSFVSLTVHCARCHDHPFDPIPQVDYYRLQAVFAGVDRADRPYATRWHGQSDAAAARAALAVLDADQARGATASGRADADAEPALVYALAAHEPRPIHRLHRGEIEQPRELVEPGALSAVAALGGVFEGLPTGDEGARRAALAAWLTDPANPLTWRSIANRVWHYHFGRGLVDTPNDLGRNGSPPSHPELLDWLAVELRDGGQSLKALHRLIVTSAVYRQSSAPRGECEAIDAENRLLWRMNRRRLDAEEIRDAILATSGRLDPTLGGPSFELFAFEDDHSPRYHYVPIDEPRVWRRTVYRFSVRSVPSPFLETLDCADPSLSVPVRSTTITALQALALLNNPFVVRQAEYLAERLEHEAADLPARIDRACELIWGRPPDEAERALLVEVAAEHGLANVGRLLWNTNEFVFAD